MAASASWDLISGSMTHYLDHIPEYRLVRLRVPQKEENKEEESFKGGENREKRKPPPEERIRKKKEDDKDDKVKESVEEESKEEEKPGEIVFGEAMSSDDECIEEVDLGSP
eukprot:jgi/Picre1/34969/NNA_002435.t1